MLNKIYLIGIASGFLILLLQTFDARILAQGSNTASVPGKSQSDLFITLFAAVLSGGGITVAGSFITTHYANKKAMDLDLRNKRMEVYRGLWQSTKSWAEYYRGEPKNSSDVDTLLRMLHDWYFDTGGMYLSNTNRENLFALKKRLIPIAEEFQKDKNKNYPLPPETRNEIIDQCHDLRTGLSQELGVRKDISL